MVSAEPLRWPTLAREQTLLLAIGEQTPGSCQSNTHAEWIV